MLDPQYLLAGRDTGYIRPGPVLSAITEMNHFELTTDSELYITLINPSNPTDWPPVSQHKPAPTAPEPQ